MAKKKQLTANLSIVGDSTYTCNTTKTYTDSFTIEQELDNPDVFVLLSTFSKDIGSLTIMNAKAIVIKNISNICAEIAIQVYDWKNSSSVDVTNSVDVGGGGATKLRTWTFLLPAKDYIYLPNSRILSYSPSAGATLESGGLAGVGTIAIEPKDINSGNEFRGVKLISGTTYGAGTEVLTDEPVARGETAIDIDDSDWFKVDDLIMIDDEVMEVKSISSNTLTVKRSLLGSTDVTHTEDDELLYFFGNEYLPFNTGRCQTDKLGRFKQRGAFFGYARTADKIADGLVAGSVAIGPFYTEGGYLDWGLSGVTSTAETGLAASTAYTFTIVVDEHHVNGFDSVTSEVNIAFTTGTDTTWAGSESAVLPKIQAIFDEQFYTTSSGLKDKIVTIRIHKGDVRVQSHSNHSETRVGIGNVTGTTPFSVGNFPALDGNNIPNLLGAKTANDIEVQADTVVYGPASSLAIEETDDRETGKTETNPTAFIFDNGKGDLLYQGSKVGWVDYEKGHCEWQVNSLPNAEFKVYAQSHSAHSGGNSYVLNGRNTIENIKARSVNPKENSKIQLILFG